MKKFSIANTFVMFMLSSIANAKNIDMNGYLLKPHGNYGIGYQDIDVVNKSFCPDKFYNPRVNEIYFSPDNSLHCHEVVVRVYYPIHSKIALGDNYYMPAMSEDNQYFITKYKLSKSDMSRLETNAKIKTYTSKNAPPVLNRRFPIIIFMPGSGQSVHTYNNIISNIVSDGYVVIGVNSVFANGPLLLSNGQLVPRPKSYNDAGRSENLGDLSVIINQLKTLPYKNNLIDSLDFTKITLIGHSMGAMNIVNLLKQKHYNEVKAVILMDPGNVLWNANYPLAKSSVPTLVMWSSYFKNASNGSMSLGKNNYSVELKSKSAKINFSNHENFSDLSTYQYHPAYQIAKIHNGLTNSSYMGVGYGNGYKIATETNNYILQFLNLYVKQISSNTFVSCKPLSKDSQLICGKFNK